MLKLVYTNPNPILGNRSRASYGANINRTLHAWPTNSLGIESVATILPHFTVKISLQESGLYKMVARDPFHYLSCTLVLEIRENEDESDFGDVICYFPAIEDEYLEAFVWEDDTLIDAIVPQFRIKILEQLILFCINRNALKLILHADYPEIDQFEAYNRFIVHANQMITPQGRKTALVIPTDRAAYDKLVEYKEAMGADFHEFLWKNQHINPIIQQYIKLNAFG